MLISSSWVQSRRLARFADTIPRPRLGRPECGLDFVQVYDVHDAVRAVFCHADAPFCKSVGVEGAVVGDDDGLVGE